MRNITRREMLRLLGLGAMGFAIAACAPKAAPEPTAEPTEAPAATAEATQAAPSATDTALPTTAPLPTGTAGIPDIQVPTGSTLEGFTPKLSNPSEKIELIYWWGNNYEPALDFTNKIIARFSLAYPNVTIKPVSGQNCDAFVTAAAAGTPPDFFHTWDCVERMGNWAARDMIIPIDEYVSKDNFPLDDYFPGILDTCKMNGKLWGLVDSAGVFLLWTRPQQFKDIGQDPSSSPKDTDELWDWARKLTTKDSSGNIQRLGMLMPNWAWTRFAWIVNFGGVLWDTTSNEPTPDHPGSLAALNDFVEQVKYYTPDALDRWSTSIGSQGGEQQPFLAGTCTMQEDADYSGQTIFDFHPEWKAGTDYDVLMVPPPPSDKLQGDSMVAWWSWPFVIPAGTKHPDWSWEVMRFFTSREYQLNVHSKFKEMVVRKSMIDDARLWWPAVKLASQIVKGARKLTTVIPMNPVAGDYINLLGEAYDNIMHLKATPESEMARVKQETLDKLKAATES